MILVINVGATDTKEYSQVELDQMLAPIALYPDALLSQILMATTYDKELEEAIEYSQNNPNEKGDAAVERVQDKGWDASVASLVAFPQVLAMLGEDSQWRKELGNAFLAEPEKMMDRIQVLRQKAMDEGNLASSEEQIVKEEVVDSTKAIIIEPVTQTVYVPVYDPMYVYGSWMYPLYPPHYYYPPHYNPAPDFIFGFAFGIIASNAMWGGFSWHPHHVYINVNRYNRLNVHKLSSKNSRINWKHNSKRLNTFTINKRANNKNIRRINAQKIMYKKGFEPLHQKNKPSRPSTSKVRQTVKNTYPSKKSNSLRAVSQKKPSKIKDSRAKFSPQRDNNVNSKKNSSNHSKRENRKVQER